MSDKITLELSEALDDLCGIPKGKEAQASLLQNGSDQSGASTLPIVAWKNGCCYRKVKLDATSQEWRWERVGCIG